MRPAEKGYLLLTSHLGDPESKPLTVAQLRRLTLLVRGAEKDREDRELRESDLIRLGYDREMAKRILGLLSREEQLGYYVNQAKKSGCCPITKISEEYPVALENRLGLDCPGCLWTKGDRGLLNQPAVALVGSRDLQENNRRFAEEVGRQAAKQGYVLVSGNARGADRTAQESCLRNGGQVISIVADSLAACSEQDNVLYISEDGFDIGFSPFRALSRNRLIHCMGLITLVAQCSFRRGGTWTGSTQNLNRGWSGVCCFQDGSPGIAELLQMGAAGVDISQLQDLSALPKKQMNMFD